MSGEAYSKRYAGGFVDDNQSFPADAQFLNAVETALTRLLKQDPTDGRVMVWDSTLGGFKTIQLTSSHLASNANIAKSQLASFSIADADVAAGAAIATSKIAAGSNGQVLTTTGGVPTWGNAYVTVGTSFPGSPNDGDEYIYVADGTNGVYWHFKYRNATGKWIFIGGAPLWAQVTASESTTSATYVALGTAGPSIALPFAGDYDIEIGAVIRAGGNAGSPVGWMSYDIGGTGALDADAAMAGIVANSGGPEPIAAARLQRKTGLTAVTLTAKYHCDGTFTANFAYRWMAVRPVQK